jgi:spore coat polysaccharide biosynthesis predicted glycosyltransferase SpsG
VTGSVLLVADAGREAGLGHIARSSAIAVALACREVETGAYAYGADAPFRFDGVDWAPLRRPEVPAAPDHVLVIDSYRLPREVIARAAASHRLVFMHDHGSVPPGAALVVSAAARSADDDTRHLDGLAYAALRPGFWGLPPRTLGDGVHGLLVATGGGRLAETGSEVSLVLAAAFPEATVTLVRGPHAATAAPANIKVLEAPRSLLEPLLAADLVVSGAGQTMLEAAAAGTPCVALPLVPNQRRQAAALADLDAVRLVDPPRAEAAAAACLELAGDADARRRLSLNGRRAVDGYGALRVAFAIARLASAS